MIAKLIGVVDGIADGYFVLMTSSGVGYQVFTTLHNLSVLKIGQRVSFFIETNVREDYIHLYGFPSQEEKAWFNLLCTVQGVGAKVALSILSSISSDQLFNSIVAGDKDFIATANGVGPKMALRIVSELKDKVEKAINNSRFISGDSESDISLNYNSDTIENKNDKDNFDTNKQKQSLIKDNINDLKMEAVSALVNLGYKKVEAFEAVAKVSAKLQENSNPETKIDVALLIKEALKEFNIF